MLKVVPVLAINVLLLNLFNIIIFAVVSTGTILRIFKGDRNAFICNVFYYTF